jgi:uncharacterized Fe-S cluster-containing radical SAM superfamily protein
VHNENMLKGCLHDCRYCYAHAMAKRFDRVGENGWISELVVENQLAKTTKRYSGRVMFPSTHDITPEHLEQSLQYIDKMLLAGNTLLIVSKPHLACIGAICTRFSPCKERILFRFTIGSANSETLKFWEPGAPDFEERLESLKCAHAQGFATSVSCEPMLDRGVQAVISQVLPYVTDSIWLGKANRLKVNLSLNGHSDPITLNRADELLSWQSDERILRLYEELGGNPKIKWKESIKKVVGIRLQTVSGMDE